VISSGTPHPTRDSRKKPGAVKFGMKNDIGAHHNNNRDNFVTITIRRSKMLRKDAENRFTGPFSRPAWTFATLSSDWFQSPKSANSASLTR
jgi:hypothetical protein